MISPEQVLKAARWAWVPKDADQMLTGEFHLIRYPDRFCDETFPPAQVVWSDGIRPAAALIDDVAALTHAWGLDEVSWSVSDGTVPEDTERVLATRGATLRETYRILAYDLSNGLPELDLADDVVAVLVQDASSLRAAFRVNSDGWNSPERSEDEFAAELARMARELETWSSFRVLASIAGEPVATGGCTMTGDVAHLLGSVTLPAWRRRGAYRAVLAERLRLAAQHGGTMAVVKGRVETSAPLLLRAGFHVFGEERRYRLPVV